jgi:cobalt-zinc-cadmium efflux system outer membrane protein
MLFGPCLFPVALPLVPYPPVHQQVVEPQTLTWEQALEQFKRKGFELLLADASVEQAKGDLASSASLPPPVLSLSAGKTAGYDASSAGAGASDRAYSATISDANSLSDLMWGKRRLRGRIGEAALEAAQYARKDAERTLSALLRQQYMQASLSQLNVEIARSIQVSSQGTLDLVKARYQAGAVSEADVARASVVALEAQQNLEGAQQWAAAAEAQLAFMLGHREAGARVKAAPGFEQPELGEEVVLDQAALLEEAKRHRPDVRANQAQLKRAEANVALAHRNWAPDLTWSFGVSQEGTGQFALQPRTYTLGLSFPLPSVRRIQGEITKAQADWRTQEILRDRMEAQVALEVTNAVHAFEISRSRLKRLRQELVPAAKRAMELVSFQYEKGATHLLDLLEARKAYLNAETEHLQGLTDYWTARFQLDQALGKEWRR